MTSTLQITCILLLLFGLFVAVISTVAITIIIVFIYNKWQTVLRSRQNLFTLKSQKLGIEKEINMLYKQIELIQKHIDIHEKIEFELIKAPNANQAPNTNQAALTLTESTISEYEDDIYHLNNEILTFRGQLLNIEDEILIVKAGISNWLT